MVRNVPTAALVVTVGVFLLSFLPHAAAQDPPALPDLSGDPTAHAVNFVVLCEAGFLQVAFAGQQIVPCHVEDLSRDSASAPDSGSGTSVSQHNLAMTIVPLNDSIVGWRAYPSLPVIPLKGGDVREFNLIVQAPPTLNSRVFAFDLVAEFTGPNDYNQTQVMPFMAQVLQYDFALVSTNGQVKKAGQDEVVRYEVVVQNTGVFPDSYRFDVNAPEGFRVSVPANIYVPPGEARSVYVSVLTPRDKVFELGKSVSMSIKVSSATGSGVYSTVAILQVRGPYIPVYWLPLVIVGLVSAGVAVDRTRERTELKRLERGEPRRVRPTPRQAVMLKQLKQRDRESWKQKRAALDAVYQQRRAEYKEHRKEVAEADREEAKRARADFKTKQKDLRAKRAEQRKVDKAQAKLDKKQAKLDRKDRRKKQKQLAQTRKKLGKQQKKADKLQAKADKKQAKLDAKQAKVDAKAAKAEARAAKKAERAAKKARK